MKQQTASLDKQTVKVPDPDTQKQVYTKHDTGWMTVCADKDSLPKKYKYKNGREFAFWNKQSNKQKILVCQLQTQSDCPTQFFFSKCLD